MFLITSPAGGRGRATGAGEGRAWACSKPFACVKHHPHPNPLPPAGEGEKRLDAMFFISSPAGTREKRLGAMFFITSPAGGRGRATGAGEGGAWACSNPFACVMHHPHPSPLLYALRVRQRERENGRRSDQGAKHRIRHGFPTSASQHRNRYGVDDLNRRLHAFGA